MTVIGFTFAVGDWTVFWLSVVSFLAGIGITALGPGGVFMTVALYALTPFAPEVVAGTGSATNVVAGVFGSAAYVHSGELLAGHNWRMALVLSVASVLGTLVGIQVNTLVSKRLFGILLGGFVTLVGVLVWYREHADMELQEAVHFGSRANLLAVVAVGIGVGIPAGLLGIGGPVLAVPLLVVLGFPLLSALAVAQVQSVFIAGSATIGYVAHGAVSMPLVAAIAVPELVGIVVGWRTAQTVDASRLKRALAAVLLALGPYLTLQV